MRSYSKDVLSSLVKGMESGRIGDRLAAVSCTAAMCLRNGGLEDVFEVINGRGKEEGDKELLKRMVREKVECLRVSGGFGESCL
jgi:hypothetical protein